MPISIFSPSSVAIAREALRRGDSVLGLEVKKVLAIYDKGFKSAGIADAIASSLKPPASR